MYAKGMTTRDISDHIEDMYGIPLSAQSISRMTDKIMPLVEEWQNRPLCEHYYFVFMDAIHYKVKQNNRIVSKAAYVVIGIDDDGYVVFVIHPMCSLQRLQYICKKQMGLNNLIFIDGGHIPAMNTENQKYNSYTKQVCMIQF